MAFDLGSPSSTSAKEQTFTASGSGKNVGDKSQLVESGSLVVSGKSARYFESGSADLGKNNKLGADFSGVKGNVTINDTGGATALALVDKLSAFVTTSPSSPSSSPGVITPPSPTAGPTVGTDLSGSPTTASPTDPSATSTTQAASLSIGALVLIGLAVWFFFFRGKRK